MSFSIDVKNYSIAAGERLRIFAPGSFFQLMESTAAVDVDFLRSESAFGRALDVPLGFSVGPLKAGEEFDGVEIYSATAQTLKVCIARGAVDLRALTQVTGTVQVINGEVERVKSGVAFSGVAGQSAVAAAYSSGQLWNPAANAKNLIVNKISVFSPTGPFGFQIRRRTAAAATLSARVSSKLLGGVAPSGQVRYESHAAGYPEELFFNAAFPAAFRLTECPFSEPFIIPPGAGLSISSSIVNVELYASFQWIEQAV